jgi:hypothetical protein
VVVVERVGVAEGWRKGALLFAGREKDAAAATKGIEMPERRGLPVRRKALANSLAIWWCRWGFSKVVFGGWTEQILFIFLRSVNESRAKTNDMSCVG